MNAIWTLMIVAAVLASLATPGAAEAIWEEIDETAPLQPVFVTQREFAP
jgi:hypothetical protein